MRFNYFVNLFVSLLSSILKVKSDGKLEVELDSSALVGSLEGIVKLDVDLRTVECTVSVFGGPFFSELIQGFGQSLLRLVPDLDLSQVFLGTG